MEYDLKIEAATRLRVEDSLIQPSIDGLALAKVANISRFKSVVLPDTPHTLERPLKLMRPRGHRELMVVVIGRLSGELRRIKCTLHMRREKLLDLVGELKVPKQERRLLCGFLAEAFYLEEGEWGETNMIQMDW